MSDGSNETASHGGSVVTATACVWTAMAAASHSHFRRGMVFHVPDDNGIDVLLMEHFDAESGFALLILTGDDAGSPPKLLPVEALFQDMRAISADWLKARWVPWVARHSWCQDAMVSDGYEIVPDPAMFPWPTVARGYDLIVDNEPLPVSTSPAPPLLPDAAPAATCAWRNLSRTDWETIMRGAVLRIPDEFAGTVDLLLAEDPLTPSDRAFVVTTGRKAGLIRLTLPDEALDQDGKVKIEWLKIYWTKWLNPNAKPEHAWISKGYQQSGAVLGDGLG